MVALFSFWSLFALTLLQSEQRQLLRQKPMSDWLLDSIGLMVQGGIIPILQTLLVWKGYEWILPHARGCLDWESWVSFLTCFVGVDYLYYWNHRWLHTPRLFPIHAVHHTVTQMDMLGSSRNTLWSSLFLPYLWVNALMLYLLKDNSSYILAMVITCLLDLWRHSSLTIDVNSILYQFLNPWLILPQNHAYHHGSSTTGNFGANLKFWDKLHNTYAEVILNTDDLGVTLDMSLIQKLFWPFF